uniref:beta strand repeat-containing protein n=1 Tax=Paraburkholderia caribensis TaxID=75105 RepID=UPI00286D5DFE|nr:YadA-like family protein [Paraburkholderia caribensis]
MAAGYAATDAVNVSQLMSEDAKVNAEGTSIANVIGGGSTYNSTTGAITGPTFNIGGKTITTIAGAITNIDGRVTQNTTDISNITTQITNGEIGLVQQAGSTATITVAKGTAGSLVDFTGTAGARKLTGVANGNVNASSVDAVNGSQLFNVAQSTANAFGGGSTVNTDGTISNPTYVVGGNTYNNVGGAITSIDGRVTNINNQVTNIVNGGGIKYFHANSTLADSVASGAESVAIGGNASATTANSVALGSNSVANSTTLGTAGFNPGGAAISAGTAAGEVSIGKAGAERRITNVAAGYAATDAVNVSQLMSEDAKVNTEGTSIANVIGGGSTYNSTTGAITGPTFNIGGKTITTIAGAITNIDGRVTQNTTDISNITTQITNGEIGLVQQAGSTATITVAKGTAGSLVDFTGTAGARKLTGVANGNVNASSVDAVNGSQLFNVAQSTANAFGGGSTVNSDGTISNPTYMVGGNTYNNVGGAITSIDGRVTNINNQVTNIVNGGGIKYFHANSTLADSVASGTESVAIGGNASATTANSVALGSNSVANSTTLGTAGFNPGGAAISAGTAAGEVSIGKAGAERRITNVAAGYAATDAVNVSQLMSEDAKVNTEGTSIANVIGGGSTYNSTTGAITGPTFNIGGKTITTIAGAITNIDGRVTQNTTDISNITTQITNGEIGLVQQAGSTATITVAKGTAGSLVDFTGTAGARKLTGVANGNVNASSVDAVNGSQLFNVAQSTANAFGGGSTVNTDGTISNPTYVINGGTTVHNAGDAITNIDGRVTQNTTDISNITTQIANGEIGLVQQAGSTATITVAKGTAGSLVDFTGTAGARKLTGVANGNVNASSVDAVNGSQLFNVAQSTANAFGGGSTVNTDGTISNPTYVINGGTTVHNAGDAITNIDGRVTQNTTDISNINSQITQITNGEIGLVQQDASTRNITVAKGTDGTIVDFTGTAGARKLTGVANGAVNASSADAVNGSQLFNVAQSTANAFGGGSTVNSDGTISNPTYVINGGNTTVSNVGDAITNIDGRVTNIDNSMNNIVNGGGIKYFHANSTLADSVASGVDSIAIGGNASATTSNSVALGSNSMTGAIVATTGATIGGQNYTFAGSAPVGTVSVGSAGQERTITNVAAGQLSASSTDAVNGSQLYATNQAVNQVQNQVNNISNTVNNLSAGAVQYDRNADGSVDYSSVTMGGGNSPDGTVIHNVAAGTDDSDAVNKGQMDAAIATVTNIANNASDPMFSANGDRNTEAAKASGTHATAMGPMSNASGNQSIATGYNAQASGDSSMAIGANSKATADHAVALGDGSVADRANTVSVGSAGKERQITNVAAGTERMDAVNVGQLNDSITAAVGDLPAGTTAKSYTDQQVNMVQQGVNSVARNAYSGIAAATALTMIPDVDQGKTIAVGVGAGSYHGYQATALGASARITQNIKVKLGAGISGQGTTVGVGASYQW